MNNNKPLITAILIAINLGIGLLVAGMNPFAVPGFMTSAFCFCHFLHLLRKRDEK